MDSDKSDNDTASNEAEENEQSTTSQAPADALSRTPEDLEEEKAAEEAAHPDTASSELAPKKVSPLKRFLRRMNVYFLFFFLILAVTGVIAGVNYFNSQKTPPEATIGTQQLSQETLKQLANTDTSVGNNSQTLTIKGNAVISGQTLARGNLNVAGNFQSGGAIQGSSVTVSGTANLGQAQINSLQVATNTAIQGSTTMRDLSVSGSSTFSGAMTASQITVTNLVLSGNATLQVPNHISVTGPTPSHSNNGGPLGGGGTASISGSDTAGTVSISTGNNPSAGCFIRVNFAQDFSKQPRVIVSPVGQGAGKTQYYVDRNNSGFSICAASPAPGNSSFAFDYFIVG